MASPFACCQGVGRVKECGRVGLLQIVVSWCVGECVCVVGMMRMGMGSHYGNMWEGIVGGGCGRGWGGVRLGWIGGWGAREGWAALAQASRLLPQARHTALLKTHLCPVQPDDVAWLANVRQLGGVWGKALELHACLEGVAALLHRAEICQLQSAHAIVAGSPGHAALDDHGVVILLGVHGKPDGLGQLQVIIRMSTLVCDIWGLRHAAR